MRVNIEDVRDIEKARSKINRPDFKQIEWYEDGKKLDIDPKILDDYEYTGLNNMDFITSDFFRNGFNSG